MWTVAGLARDLAEGRTASRKLVEEALARIADPAGEGARATAAAIERVLAAGG